jgi:hypothetical protein
VLNIGGHHDKRRIGEGGFYLHGQQWRTPIGVENLGIYVISAVIVFSCNLYFGVFI